MILFWIVVAFITLAFVEEALYLECHLLEKESSKWRDRIATVLACIPVINLFIFFIAFVVIALAIQRIIKDIDESSDETVTAEWTATGNYDTMIVINKVIILFISIFCLGISGVVQSFKDVFIYLKDVIVYSFKLIIQTVKNIVQEYGVRKDLREYKKSEPIIYDVLFGNKKRGLKIWFAGTPEWK